MCKAAPPGLGDTSERGVGVLQVTNSQLCLMALPNCPMCDTTLSSIKNELNGSGKNSRLLHGESLRSHQLKLPARTICSTGN